MMRGQPEGYLPPQQHPQGYGVEYYVPQSPTGYITYAPPPPCHFFNTAGGCRKGNACPFLHISYDQPQQTSFAPPMMSAEEFYFFQQQEFFAQQAQHAQYYGIPPPMSPPPHTVTSPPRHAGMPESVSSPPPSESSESDLEEMSIEQRLFIAAQRYERDRMNAANAGNVAYQQ
jgi:hypothetical protein